MKITPETHILEALRSQSFGWRDGLGELIDNAFDADATEVKIDFQKDSLRVSDDGIGCSDLHAMFTPGSHRPHSGRKGLGRFGVGFKDTALWLWGITTVESVRGGRFSSAQVDWNLLEKSGEWEIEDPLRETAGNRPPGTIITFNKIQRRHPHGKDFDSLVRDMEFIFAPALKNGRRIVFSRPGQQRIVAHKFDWPTRTDVLTGQLEVSGRAVRVNIGIVPDGISNPHSGLSYVFRHRIIIPQSSLGCGGFSPARIFGFVELQTEDWRLSKNKNDIVEFKEELAEAVEGFCRPVLEKAGHQAQSVELRELGNRITSMIRAAISGKGDEKEKREKPDDSKAGTVEPVDTGKKRRDAERRQPGGNLLNRLSPRLRVEFVDLDESEGIDQVDAAGDVIRLKQDHPFILLARRSPSPFSDYLIFELAMGALAHHSASGRGQNRVLEFVDELPEDRRFSVAMSRMLASLAQKLGSKEAAA